MNTPSTATVAGEKNVAAAEAGAARERVKVITASSVASVFEWFDFFLYGEIGRAHV